MLNPFGKLNALEVCVVLVVILGAVAGCVAVLATAGLQLAG